MPSVLMPPGIEIAGWPVRLNGAVKIAAPPVWGCALALRAALFLRTPNEHLCLAPKCRLARRRRAEIALSTRSQPTFLWTSFHLKNSREDSKRHC